MNKNHLSEQNPYREELENLHQNIERARHAHRKWWNPLEGWYQRKIKTLQAELNHLEPQAQAWEWENTSNVYCERLHLPPKLEKALLEKLEKSPTSESSTTQLHINSSQPLTHLTAFSVTPDGRRHELYHCESKNILRGSITLPEDGQVFIFQPEENYQPYTAMFLTEIYAPFSAVHHAPEQVLREEGLYITLPVTKETAS